MLLAVALAAIGASATAAFAPSSIIPPSTVPKYELLELPILMPEPVANPFNVSSLQTWVTVTGPGVQEVAFPFRKQNFNRAQDPFGNEVLTPVGDPFFAVRVAPTSLGEFTVVQHFSPGTNTTGIVPLNITFLATPPLRDDGFACVDPGFGQFFKLDSDDAAFWLVGENMGWSGVWPYFNGSSRWSNGTGGTFMYDRYLSRLAAAGGNWIRLWLGPSLVSEPSWDGEQGSFLAMSLMGEVPFGEYSLAAAWRIDHVVETCRALGIKITVVLDAQQACCTPGTWCFWAQSTYNSVNGGPLDDPADVWTNAATVAELHQRWDYVLSRWAYSTSVFSWELANENDDWAGWGPAGVQVQIALAAHLRASDPRHMVDDSFGNPGVAQPGIEGSPLIAFTSAHNYNAPDFAEAVWSSVTPRVAKWGKPAFMEEFGASWTGPLEHELDPTGIGLHNGAWASLVGLGAGTAMQWWWNEVDALGVYDRLSGAANLASTLAPTRLGLNWTIWNNCSDPKPQSAHGGWTVGMDASGAAKQILFWVYNRNHTWSGMHNGAVLQPITGCATLLRGLPTPATGVTVNITWVNTTTGTPITPDVSRQSNGGIRVYVNGARLAEPPRTVDARHTLAYGNAVSEESVQVPALVGAIDVEIVAPTFLTDVAAVVDLIPTAFDRSS